MILIVGGKEQGRLCFAMSEFGVAGGDVFDCSQRVLTGDVREKIIYGIDEFVKTNDIDGFLTLHGDMLCDKIVITAERGCGIVPIDAEEREVRGKIGRANCMLAEKADEVYRVVCGLGMRIK